MAYVSTNQIEIVMAVPSETSWQAIVMELVITLVRISHDRLKITVECYNFFSESESFKTFKEFKVEDN